MLALEVLSKMPKVHKHSSLSEHKDTGDTSELSMESKNGQTSDPVWSQSALNGYESDGLSNSQSDSVLSFDWSQPSLTVPDESLELKWDSDRDEEDEDEDEEETKNVKCGKNANSSSVFLDSQDTMSPIQELVMGEDTEDSNDFITPSNDILAAQLKFTACLKIMTNELRTLSTGYELEGGKLRYQLYQWLEREVRTTNTLKRFNRLTFVKYWTLRLTSWFPSGGGSPALLQLQALFARTVCPGGGAGRRSRNEDFLDAEIFFLDFLLSGYKMFILIIPFLSGKLKCTCINCICTAAYLHINSHLISDLWAYLLLTVQMKLGCC